MPKGQIAEATDARRLLVARIASSRYVNRSARLRDLLLYLVDRVLDEQAGDIHGNEIHGSEIHEQEVGHKVFNRPVDYDTSSDNIVRVHASMLRKRLEQYFSSEGANEPLILEIGKGNYTPVFRPRQVDVGAAEGPGRTNRWPVWVLAGIAILLACSTLYLLLRSPSSGPEEAARANVARPTVRLFWDQVFQPNRTTDIVLEDAAVGLYRELTGRELTLSNYYDRAYLQNLPETAREHLSEMARAAHLDQHTVASIVLRRQTSFSGTNFLWKLMQTPGLIQRPALLRFARDYSFRELKANNVLLLGNSLSNPWVEPFEAKLGLRWVFDPPSGSYYPADAWAGNKKYQLAAQGETREGYCSISLLPNLGQTGNALIIAGTGGSAVNAAADFLNDEPAMLALRRSLQAEVETKDHRFPYFEALIKVKGRGGLPKDASIVLSRAPSK